MDSDEAEAEVVDDRSLWIAISSVTIVFKSLVDDELNSSPVVLALADDVNKLVVSVTTAFIDDDDDVDRSASSDNESPVFSPVSSRVSPDDVAADDCLLA